MERPDPDDDGGGAIHVPTLSMEIPSEIKSVTRSATKVANPLKALTDRRPRARVNLRAGAGERLGGADLGLPHHQLQRWIIILRSACHDRGVRGRRRGAR